MTDKELKTLFDAVKDFDDFKTKVINRQNIFLKDGFSIVFHDNSHPPAIDITIEERIYIFDNSMFSNMIREMISEKNILDKEESRRKEQMTSTRIRNEIFHLKENIYKIHDEYIQDMLIRSDIASTHGAYLKKLQELLDLFKNDNILYINEQRINSGMELKSYLKSAGFQYIDKDLS